jgi:DtxR family transcriptional regulator, Mn-dependent transcriptional regulator
MSTPLPADNHARHASERQPAISAAMEDYLKAIYRLQQGDERVNTLALAGELQLSGPSVTNMVKRLAELGLVEHNRYYGVRLTDAGTRVALEVIRHHRLLELYLAEAMGFEWDKVHDEAERLEHHVSSEFESRMDELLGHPEYDPHGDPIPSARGTLPESAWHPLDEVPAGSTVILRRVSDRDSEHLRYLSEIGLAPGARFEVIAADAEGDWRIRTETGEHAIPADFTAGMQVERV